MTYKHLLALLCIINAIYTTHASTPYFSKRSQSVDLSRQVVGTRNIERQLQNSTDCWPGFASITLESTQSFHAQDITRCLFNTGCHQFITISGSGVADRGTNDWLADYFGLPTDFQSTVLFNPTVCNVIADFQGYLRLDTVCKGLYFYIHAPLTHTKWNLHACENVIQQGSASYVEGYFSDDIIERTNLLHTASAFFSGQQTPTIEGQTFNKLANARWALDDCSSRTKTELADLRMWLGYDWFSCDAFNFGFGAVIAAPTGNAPDGTFLFEPIAGNGKHWELGIMVKGDTNIWENCNGTHRIDFFTQANITHLFKSKQKRTFDLVGKPLSRYMLAEKLGANNTAPYLYGNTSEGLVFCPTNVDLGNPILSNFKFANEYTPVANLTTLCVDVTADVQVDWVAVATYTQCNFTWDIGYELWYRGCENIIPRNWDDALLAENTWALKGDAHVFGFGECTDAPFTDGQPVALAATEHNATLFTGTNAGLTSTQTNPGIDNAQFAFGGSATPAATAFTTLSGTTAQTQAIFTSIQPVFITSDDIDICSARTKGFSNKFFTHINYFWDDSCLNPFIGLGGMVEFGANKSASCASEHGCSECTLSQWGVWIKGGIFF